MPDWWDDSCAREPSLLDEIEFRVSRFLGLPLGDVRDPKLPLFARSLEGARLRHTRNLDPARLLAAVHAGTEIAAAVARSSRAARLPLVLPPENPLAWRAELNGGSGPIELGTILADLWKRGVPVIRIKELPSPKYQGMACIVEGRPVIVLGHAHDEPPRLAFLIAHELAHVVHGDCEPDHPVIDEDESVDVSDMELRADRYAWQVLTGGTDLPAIEGSDFRALAQQASDHEAESGVDAGFVVWAWANRTGAYETSVMALKALYLHRGAGQLVARNVRDNLDLDSASETDRSLLACIDGVEGGSDGSSV